MNKHLLSKVFTALLSLIFVFAIFSCKDNKGKKPQAPAYKVTKLEKGSGEIGMEFPTTIESSKVIEIRSRVDGYIDAVLVQEGAVVRKGQVLFKINDDSFSQKVKGAQADVAAAQAGLENAKLEVRNVEPLVEKGIMSPVALEAKNSDVLAAEARVLQAKSGLESAKIDLSYTSITATESGVVSQVNVRNGSLVKTSDQKPLTTLSASGDVFAYFSISEQLLMSSEKDTSAQSFTKTMGSTSATLIFSDGLTYYKLGKLEFASRIIDKNTGSILVKAIFPNTENILATGLSGIIRIPIELDGVFMVPKEASYELQDKIMIMLVNDKNEVYSKEISIVGVQGNNYLVEKGLENGNVLLLEGIGLLKDGQVISPEYVTISK